MNSDPAFRAEILTLANSALYARQTRIDTVSPGHHVFGLERTRAFAATVALQGMITSIENKTVVHDCWQHSRATAIVAEYLAPFFRIHPEQAYLIQRASFSVNHCDAGFWLTHLWRLPGDS